MVSGLAWTGNPNKEFPIHRSMRWELSLLSGGRVRIELQQYRRKAFVKILNVRNAANTEKEIVAEVTRLHDTYMQNVKDGRTDWQKKRNLRWSLALTIARAVCGFGTFALVFAAIVLYKPLGPEATHSITLGAWFSFLAWCNFTAAQKAIVRDPKVGVAFPKRTR